MKKTALIVFIVLLLCTLGCSSPVLNPGAGGQGTGGEPGSAAPPAAGDLAVSGGAVEGGVIIGENITETTTVVLYFADDGGDLVPQQREVPKVPGIARRALEELCRGPQQEGLLATIPPGTRLLDINIRDHLCTVDFSEELVRNHPGGSSGELLTVYSIVNTLTQFPTVEKVLIRVDGQVVPTLAGHFDLSIPLERNSSILGN